MSFDITYPKITALNNDGKLEQIRAYLYQLADQLKWALNSIGSGGNNVVLHKGSDSNMTTEEEAKAVATFNSIKALIIKSADIVNTYYDVFNEKFSGEYVAQSDFGIFTELTTQNVIANSTSIESLFESMQEILTDIKNLEHSLIEVNAHIKTGLLSYDDSGVPIYGLEIGQINEIDGEEVFNKYARFTSDRLSFYDQNDTEVAYVSDYKLYITNAEITGKLKLGAFELNTANGLTLKYVGRG